MKRAVCALVATLVLASLAHATTFYVTVAGLGGEPDYEQRFASLAQEIDKLVHAPTRTPKSPRSPGPKPPRRKCKARSGRSREDAKPADALVVMLIGHGSFDGFEYKINLPGPDLSGVELAALLDRIPAARASWL